MKTGSFEDCEGWQKARKLRKTIRDTLRSSTEFREFEFDRQIYSAALSIMNNVAEGWESSGQGDKARFFSYAQRSCGEVRSLLYAGLDDCFFTEGIHNFLKEMCLETTRIIAGLFRSVRRRAG